MLQPVQPDLRAALESGFLFSIIDGTKKNLGIKIILLTCKSSVYSIKNKSGLS